MDSAYKLNGLGYTSQTLYLQSQSFEDKEHEDKATQRLPGKNVKPEHINDDVLSRCFDKLYEFGLTNHTGMPDTQSGFLLFYNRSFRIISLA